jgi:primosomal protein N' (replication factor Y)
VEDALRERGEAGYPPYRRLATLLFAGSDAGQVEAAAEACAESLREPAESRRIEVLGPAPQTLAKLRGKHRWHVLLKGEGAAVRACAALGLEWAESPARPSNVRVQADVDPVEVL